MNSANRIPQAASFPMLARATLVAGLGAVMVTVLPNFAGATAQTAPTKPVPKPASTAPKTVAAAEPQVAIVESQPVIHAKSAAVTTCLTAVSELARMNLDAPYVALSTWNKSAANDHLFESIVGLKYDNQVAPRAISVLTASPTPAKNCDGGSVQVQPSNLSCEAIAKNLTNASMKTTDLNGVTMIAGEGPMRYALLPTAGNGCAVVGIGTYFAK